MLFALFVSFLSARTYAKRALRLSPYDKSLRMRYQIQHSKYPAHVQNWGSRFDRTVSIHPPNSCIYRKHLNFGNQKEDLPNWDSPYSRGVGGKPRNPPKYLETNKFINHENQEEDLPNWDPPHSRDVGGKPRNPPKYLETNRWPAHEGNLIFRQWFP